MLVWNVPSVYTKEHGFLLASTFAARGRIEHDWRVLLLFQFATIGSSGDLCVGYFVVIYTLAAALYQCSAGTVVPQSKRCRVCPSLSRHSYILVSATVCIAFPARRNKYRLTVTTANLTLQIYTILRLSICRLVLCHFRKQGLVASNGTNTCPGHCQCHEDGLSRLSLCQLGVESSCLSTPLVSSSIEIRHEQWR